MIGPYRRSFERIRAGLSEKSTSLASYITRETYINLSKFSFFGHEYQSFVTKLVESNPDVKLSVMKSSQIGISELFHRVILAKMALIPGTSILLAMPTITFTAEVFKTRLNNVIDQSPALRGLINRNVDSATVKMFTNGSIVYGLGAGAQSNSSLINRPIQVCIVDELDKCDRNIVTGFRSRQTHSRHKPMIYISTPTVEGTGIDAEFSDSGVQYRQTVICNHCGEEFYPDYFKDVYIKGFDAPMETLTRHHVEALELNLDKTALRCPACKRTPSLQPEHRHWDKNVISSHNEKIGVRLSPFDAPGFITAADLVRSSLTYSSGAEFRNQALGLTSKISDSSIAAGDIYFTKEEPGSGTINILGLDLGKFCHAVVAAIDGNGKFLIHHVEVIPLNELEIRIGYLYAQYNLATVVADSLPYTDIINRFTAKFPNFWSALYFVPTQPVPEMYKIKLKDDSLDRVAGKLQLVSINKNPFFDFVATMLQSQTVVFKSSEYDSTIVQHITDMRRVRDYRFQEVRYKWVKSHKKQDHFFHALVYVTMAGKLMTRSGITLNPKKLINTFRLKHFY